MWSWNFGVNLKFECNGLDVLKNTVLYNAANTQKGEKVETVLTLKTVETQKTSEWMNRWTHRRVSQNSDVDVNQRITQAGVS